MIPYISTSEVPSDETARTCLFNYSISWWGSPNVGAVLSVSVNDMITGQQIATGKSNGWTGWTRKSNLSNAIAGVWRDLQYVRFSQSINEANLAKLAPPDLPILNINEDVFRARDDFDTAEGIFASANNSISILIQRDITKKTGDFYEVVLRSSNPYWKRGELKISLTETASPNFFMGNYYDNKKKRVEATFIVKDVSIEAQTNYGNITFIRLFPKNNSGITRKHPLSGGTGVFISQDGLVLTAAHVINGAESVKVLTADGLMAAEVVKVDSANDVAVLRCKGKFAPVPVTNSKAARMGQAVFTIGFPQVELQGFNPKFTKGEISSQTGFQDDPRHWQISVPVQPGNSGGPLFDVDGAVVGLVVPGLDIEAAARTGHLPQNVNYALKSAYLRPLLEECEVEFASSKEANIVTDGRMEDVIERVQKSVVLVLVYGNEKR
jgi:S1-C subfamily serine protease